jgi:hypothetical protein
MLQPAFTSHCSFTFLQFVPALDLPSTPCVGHLIDMPIIGVVFSVSLQRLLCPTRI